VLKRPAVQKVRAPLGYRFRRVNVTNLRYAEDAVLEADGRKKLQTMKDRLKDTCKDYGMDINVKKDESDGDE
jgi:hypothetical protein